MKTIMLQILIATNIIFTTIQCEKGKTKDEDEKKFLFDNNITPKGFYNIPKTVALIESLTTYNKSVFINNIIVNTVIQCNANDTIAFLPNGELVNIPDNRKLEKESHVAYWKKDGDKIILSKNNPDITLPEDNHEVWDLVEVDEAFNMKFDTFNGKEHYYIYCIWTSSDVQNFIKYMINNNLLPDDSIKSYPYK